MILVAFCLSSVPVAAADANETSRPDGTAVAAVLRAPEVTRPAALPALYVSLVALQAWDVHTTSAALKTGAREANPVASPFAGSSAQIIALKAASTASTIFFAERLWKQNKVAAVVVMAAINGGTVAVAMNNARIARRGR
jgi:hypothetical protein